MARRRQRLRDPDQGPLSSGWQLGWARYLADVLDLAGTRERRDYSEMSGQDLRRLAEERSGYHGSEQVLRHLDLADAAKSRR